MASNIDASTLDLQERVVAINRVSKTVKGGRVMKFSALVVVGNGDGIVGFGIGKAAEVPDAIRKGIEDAKKHLTRIAMRGTTIPHDIMGEFGAGRVILKPAARSPPPPVPALSPAALCVPWWSALASAISAPRPCAPTTPAT